MVKMKDTEAAIKSAIEDVKPKTLHKIKNSIKNFPALGVILGFLSGIFFATGSLIVKLLPNVHAYEIVAVRYVKLNLLFNIMVNSV